MLEHSDEIDRAVAGLRARRSPPAGVEARVFAALELEFAGPPTGGGSTAGGGVAPIDASWVAKVIGAGATMTAGGLALLRAGAIVVGMAGDASEPSEPARVEASERGPASSPSERSSEPVVSEPVVGEPIVSEPIAGSAPSQSATTRAGATSGSPSELAERGEPEPDALAIAAEDLEAELALLRAARAQTDPERALARLDDHARKFPKGSLADEREALRVVALCKLDRLAQARTAARSLVASRPSSPLLDRMREGCPALADELDLRGD